MYAQSFAVYKIRIKKKAERKNGISLVQIKAAAMLHPSATN